MPPVIALLTDFGLRDHYVAAMKGMILGISPGVSLVDITHDIPPQDITAGALELAACYHAFPPDTIFLAVVDPGVGTGRRAIAATAAGYRFVAPDNGLLSPILEQDSAATVVEIRRAEYAATSVSRTFEGRDRFAPAAAWLATGVAVERLGPRVDGWVALHLPKPTTADGRIDGVVVRVDRFGNVISNICGRSVTDACRETSRIRVSVGGRGGVPLVATYSDVPLDELCALIGSTGHVEVSVNGGSAAERLGVGIGARVTVEFQS